MVDVGARLSERRRSIVDRLASVPSSEWPADEIDSYARRPPDECGIRCLRSVRTAQTSRSGMLASSGACVPSDLPTAR